MKIRPIAAACLAQRRRCSLIVSAGLVLIVATEVMAWTQFQGDAGHSGYVPTYATPYTSTPTWTLHTLNFYDPTPATRFNPGIASDGQRVFVRWAGYLYNVSGLPRYSASAS